MGSGCVFTQTVQFEQRRVLFEYRTRIRATPRVFDSNVSLDFG
jgi:hypothetical protein